MRGRAQLVLAVAAATVALGGGTVRAATPAAAPGVATIRSGLMPITMPIRFIAFLLSCG